MKRRGVRSGKRSSFLRRGSLRASFEGGSWAPEDLTRWPLRCQGTPSQPSTGWDDASPHRTCDSYRARLVFIVVRRGKGGTRDRRRHRTWPDRLPRGRVACREAAVGRGVALARRPGGPRPHPRARSCLRPQGRGRVGRRPRLRCARGRRSSGAHALRGSLVRAAGRRRLLRGRGSDRARLFGGAPRVREHLGGAVRDRPASERRAARRERAHPRERDHRSAGRARRGRSE